MPKKTKGSSKSTADKPRRKRAYDNSSRSLKSAETQSSIIEALVELLVERRGGEVHMDEIAKKLDISERTIFRFFTDKKKLHEAMDVYLLSYLKASGEQMQLFDFIGFAVNAYKLFDKYENLTMAYILSPFGQETRQIFRKKLNEAMIAKIVAEKKLTLNPERLKRLALVTSLVNAKIWYDIKSDYNYSGEEMGPSLQWALEALLSQI